MFEIPKYQASRDVHPSPNKRFKFEPPLAYILDSDEWQQGDRVVRAGEVIATKSWPHSSFRALNYSAAQVLQFFNERQKSRLPIAPWRGNRIVLDDGLSGTPPLQGTLRPNLPTAPVPARPINVSVGR